MSKKYASADGGRAPEQFAALSADPLSRFGTLHQSGREVKGARGFVTLSECFVRYLDRDTAWHVWSTSLTEEERSCFALCVAQGLPQRETALRLGLSQSTVHRRLQSASAALAAARG